MPRTPDPSSRIDYQVTVNQVFPITWEAVDTDGNEVSFPDGTYTIVGGHGLATAGTVDVDGSTLTTDWPVETHAAIIRQPWELRLDGNRFANGMAIPAKGTPAPGRTQQVTLNIGDGPTITATLTFPGAGTGTQRVASVILYTEDLTPSNGDPVYWIAYTPGHVDTGGEGGSARVPTGWEVVSAYEWGDESWNPPSGGTDVLLLLDGDYWPSTLATAGPVSLTAKSVPGGTLVSLGCGGSYGSEGAAVWVARNFDGFEGASDPSEPAIEFVPSVVGDQSVQTGGWTGALADKYTLRQVLTSIDAGDLSGSGVAATYTIPFVGQWNSPLLSDQPYFFPVFMIGCLVDDITPTAPRPFLVQVLVSAIEGAPPTDPVSVDDIPTNWTIAQDIESADIYGALLLPLPYLVPPYLSPPFEDAYPFGEPIWYRGRSVDAEGHETNVYFYFPDGIPATAIDVDVVMFSEGVRSEHTIGAPPDDTTAGPGTDMTVVYRALGGTGAAAEAKNVDARFAALQVDSGVSLGETSTTAYRGDRGKTAYDHSQAAGNPHGAAVADITGLTAALAAKEAAGVAAALVDDLSGVTNASAARTSLGLGTAATAASTAFQPADSDLTAIAALSTTAYGRSLLELADAAAARTSLGLGSGAVVPAQRRISVACAMQPPNSYNTWSATSSTVRYGGYGTSAAVSNGTETWTYYLVMDAGTWTFQLTRRTNTTAAQIQPTLGGTALNLIEGYSASNAADVVATQTGITISTAGVITLTFTNPTHHASSGGWGWTIQGFELWRTGA